MIFNEIKSEESDKVVFGFRYAISQITTNVDGNPVHFEIVDNYEVAIGPEQIKKTSQKFHKNMIKVFEEKLKYVFKKEGQEND